MELVLPAFSDDCVEIRMFQEMYRISGVLPQELAAEVYRSSGENEADDIFRSEHAGELTRSWLVPPSRLDEMVRQLSTAGFRDLTYARSIVHLMAVAPKDVMARVILDIPPTSSATIAQLNDLISDGEILDFKGFPKDADLLLEILARHKVDKALAMEAFVHWEGKPQV